MAKEMEELLLWGFGLGEKIKLVEGKFLDGVKKLELILPHTMISIE